MGPKLGRLSSALLSKFSVLNDFQKMNLFCCQVKSLFISNYYDDNIKKSTLNLASPLRGGGGGSGDIEICVQYHLAAFGWLARGTIFGRQWRCSQKVLTRAIRHRHRHPIQNWNRF